MNLGTIWAELGISLVKFDEGLREAESKIKQAEQKFDGLSKAGDRATAAGKKMTMGLTLPLVAAAGAAVKLSADFEQSMANAASVSGATAAELQHMTDVAREMGSRTAFSAKEAGDAMYYMASAGWDADQMAKAIEPTLALAAATQHDLAATTDTVVATLNQFGLASEDAERVSNVFAAAIGNSQANMDKLAYSMRYVGPVANALEYEVEQTTAALMGLYDAGFQGEQAGTILRGALTSLLNPTKAMEEAADSLGVSLSDLDPATNDLVDIIRVLEEAEIDAATASKLFGQVAGPGMLALIGQGADAIEAYEESITGTNAAAEMAEKQLETLQGQLKILGSAFSEVALMVGDILIPILTDFVQNTVLPIVQRIQELDEKTLKFLLTIAGIVAAVGPVLLVFGSLAKAVVAIAQAKAILAPLIMKGVVPAVMALGKALLFLVANPVGLVIMAVAALVAGAIYLWKNWDEVVPKLQEGWEKFKEAAATAAAAVIAWLAELPEKIGQFLVDAVARFIEWRANITEQAIQAGIDFLSAAGEWLLKFFTEDLPFYLGYGIGLLVGWAIDTGVAAYEAGREMLTNFIAWLAQLPENLQLWLTDALARLITWAGNVRDNAIQAGQDALNNFINFMKELPGQLQQWLTDAVARLITFATEAPAKAKEAGEKALNGFINVIKDLPSKLWAILVEAGQSLLKIGGTLYNNAKTAASNLWEGFKKGIGKSSPSFLEKAMDEIAERSGALKDELQQNFRGLDNLTGKAAQLADEALKYAPKDGPQTPGGGTGTGVSAPGGGKVTNINMEIHNPAPEPASDSATDAMLRLAHMGVV